MKVVLTEQETVSAAILYLKSENLLKNDLEYTGKLTTYDNKEFLTISELKTEIVPEVKERS